MKSDEELREIALAMAIDVGKHNDIGEDDILAVAQKFFDFMNNSNKETEE
jgi:hypothetical protein